MSEPWTVPRLWEGETAFVLGGGPSLKGFDASVLKGRGRVIATNEAGLSLCPWADVLYWADKRWLGWHHERLGEHRGKYKVCRFAAVDGPDGLWGRIASRWDIKILPHSKEPLATDGRALSGFCSGGAAINLAYLFGCNPIVLLGFDMSGDNFHDRHLRGHEQSRYETHFMPPIRKMAGPLKERGVRVLNATPGSALDCFERVDLDEILRRARPTGERAKEPIECTST